MSWFGIERTSSLAEEAAALYGIPAIGLEDVAALADFLSEHYVRPRVTAASAV